MTEHTHAAEPMTSRAMILTRHDIEGEEALIAFACEDCACEVSVPRIVPREPSVMDELVGSLRNLVQSLGEYPADWPDDLLIEAASLGARIKGLADTERLTRTLGDDTRKKVNC